MTKKLLILAALGEAGFGLLLLAYPVVVGRLLFAADVFGIAITVGRLTGICLIALGVACWPDNGSLRAFYGMMTWSVLAMVYLIVVGLGGQVGILLWPGVVVHAVIVILLIRARSQERKTPAA